MQKNDCRQSPPNRDDEITTSAPYWWVVAIKKRPLSCNCSTSHNISMLSSYFFVDYYMGHTSKPSHYAPETFKMWSSGLTLLKFDHFTTTFILHVNSNGQKMSFMAILESWTLNFGKFGTWKSEPLKLPKMTFLDCLNSPKLDFT